MTTEFNHLISIIVPCYNQAKFLSETLDSILAQAYSNWECIIVNDGSPDNTHEIAESYCRKDARFKYFYKENGGLSSARNAGISISNGEFIQLLDSDDLISPDKLKLQFEFLESHHNTGVIYCPAKYFQDGQWGSFYNGIDKRKRYLFLRSMTPTLVNLLDHNCMAVCSPLIRRDVFRKVGVFDVQLQSFEDWDFWLRCIKSGVIFKSTKLSGCTAFIRIHGTSMSWNSDKIFRSYVQMIQKHSLESFITIDKSWAFKKNYKLTIVKNVCFHIVESQIAIDDEMLKTNFNLEILNVNEFKRLLYIQTYQAWFLMLYKWYLIVLYWVIRLLYQLSNCKRF